MGKNEQSVGKKGWQSFNAEDNTHSSSSDLLHLLWEYIVLAKPKNCPSILAKTHLYLDQEKKRKPPHFEDAVFCPDSPSVTSSPFQKKPVFHICPNTPPFTLPTYLSKSSGYLFSSSCHHPLLFLLLAEQVTNLCPFLFMASQAWHWWKVIWLLDYSRVLQALIRHQWSLTISSLKGGTTKTVVPYPGSLNSIQILWPQCFLLAGFKQLSSVQLRGSNEGNSDATKVSAPLQ